MTEKRKTKKQLVDDLAEARREISRLIDAESRYQKVERALRASDGTLRLFIEHAPAAIAMFDRDMRYITFSRRWLMDYGLGEQDITGRTHYEIFPEIPERWKKIHQRGLAGEHLSCEEDPFTRADGRIDWVRWEVLPWYDHSGEIGGIIMFTEVITQRKQDGVALQEAKDYAQRLIDTANAMVVGLDLQGNIRIFNQAAEKVTGYARDEVKNRNWFELFVPKDRYPQVWSFFQGAISGELPKNFENPILTRTGEERHVIWQNSTVSEHGRAVGTVSFGIDITERRQAEEAMRLANERLQMAQLAAGEGVWDWDITTGKLQWDPQIFHLFGLDPQKADATFDTWRSVLHPDDRELAAVRIEEALEDHRVLSNEYRVVHPDGTVRWISALGRSVYDDRGRPLRMIGICMDITERKQSEEDLARYRSHLEELVRERTREVDARNTRLQKEISERKKAQAALTASEEKYRIVVENAYEAIIVAQDGMFRFVNSRALELLRYPREELISQPFSKMIHPEDRDIVLERHRKRIMDEDLPKSYDFRIIDKDGSVKWVEINTVRILWNGSPATLNFLIDITGRKQAEEEKQRLEDELMQSKRIEAIGRFAGGIAHDLNNILYPIVVNAEILLEESQEDSDQRQMLQELIEAAYRQRDLVKQILSFSRQSEQKFTPVHVEPLLQEALKFIRSSLPSTIEMKHRIDVRSDLVMGDPTQIHQIIMNLMRNAADALGAQQGTIEVGLANVHLPSGPETREGEYLELTVSDTGSGMSQEVREKIFDPFFTTKEIGKGSGMGLSFTHGILKSHGGSILVESEPGRGSRFIVHIPLFKEQPKGQARRPDQERHHRPGPSKTSRWIH